MNILFDIVHPVDVNFFKQALAYLEHKGHDVKIVYRQRGKLAKILEYELGRFQPLQIGFHKKNRSAKIAAQIVRDFSLIRYIKNQKIDLVVCFGANSGVAACFTKVPYLAFTDDFEYKLSFYQCHLFATRVIYPDFISFRSRKSFPYHGFKELAYLHPMIFQPTLDALKPFHLRSDMYVFIRVVANISLNYANKEDLLPGLISGIRKIGLTPVLSIESDIGDDRFEDCIILREPVKDIHSILYHALFAISSGDTVAREAALLGVPAISIGGRSMAVNQVLIDQGALFCSTELPSILNKIDEYRDVEYKKQLRPRMVDLIRAELADTNDIILKHIHDFTG